MPRTPSGTNAHSRTTTPDERSSPRCSKATPARASPQKYLGLKRKEKPRLIAGASLFALVASLLHLGKLLQESVVLLEALLGTLEHSLGVLLADLLDELLEAVLAAVLRERALGEADGVGLVGRVELKLLLGERRIVAPEREVDRVNGGLLVGGTRLRQETLLDAVRVSDDERGTVVVLSLVEGLDRSGGIGTHRDVGDVDVLVLHLHETEVLLGLNLTGSGELGDRAGRRGLGSLTAGVGVDFGIHDENLDVLAGGENMVETAVTDIVGPAVTAENPDGLTDEVIGDGEELTTDGAGAGTFLTRAAAVLESSLELGDGGAHLFDALTLLVVLVDAFDLRQDRLDGLGSLGLGENLVDEFHGEAVELVGGNAHTETELGVVFEERVGPRGTAAVGALAVRGRREVAAVDRRAARRVGDEEAVAAKLGKELDVRSFTAARASAGELKERTLKLAVEKHLGIELSGINLGKIEEELPVGGLGLTQRNLLDHLKRTLSLHRALDDAELAAHAVFRSNLDGDLLAELGGELTGVDRLERLGSALESGGGIDLHADSGVRADSQAVAALDTGGGIPSGDERGDVALLPLGRGGRPCTVVGDSGNGKLVTLLGDHLGGDVLDEVGSLGSDRGGHLELTGRLSGIFNLLDSGGSGLDALPVHLDDVLALLGVSLLGIVLKNLDRIELGAVGLRELNAGELEERGLENRVRARTHAVLASDLSGVDYVKLKLLVDNSLLDFIGHVIPDLGGRVGRSEEEYGAGLGGLEHVILLEVGEAVASGEVGRVDEVGAADHLAAEAEVGDRNAAGLLGVVLEVTLSVVLGVVTDDLDGVLVGSDRAVGAETPEHALLAVALGNDEFAVAEDVAAHDVIDDADDEVVDRLLGRHVRVDVGAHLRSEVLRTDTVAAGENLRICVGNDAFLLGLTDRGADVEVERIVGAGLFRAVENGYALDRGGNGGDEILHRERTIEVNLDETDLLAFLNERFDGLVERIATGAHRDDDVLGIGGADVIVKLVRAARELGELVHVLLDDGGRGDIVLLAALAALEVDVGVLRRTAHRRMLGIESALAEIFDILLVDHLADLIHRNLVDLLDFVGRAEAVEEVEERNLGLERRGVGDHRHIVGFLNGVGAEHREAGLTAGHNVAVVTENAETLASERAGGNVEDRRSELTGDLVHVGDHEEQALRRRKGRRQRAGRQRTVHGTGGAAFGFHFDDRGNRAPDVRLRERGELIARLGHGRGRGDRIDRGHFGARERDLGGGGIAVNHDLFSHFPFPSLYLVLLN